ncbi:MAG: sulfurtransferase complex subunit TusB [Anaerolineaceae bacterium]|nr:sulfurtransferase complex subunit TusB [Anaerolineaceae bacterium]
MLFTVNKPSLTSNSLDSALRIAPQGTPFLLYEDGVFIAKTGAKDSWKIENTIKDHPFYALDVDLEARGIVDLIEGIEIISYDGFIELIETHEVIPWL